MEHELIREIVEELDVKLEPKDIKLLCSRIGDVRYEKHSKPLNIDYTENSKFVWNTYVIKNFSKTVKLHPGSDCKELKWIDLDKIAETKLISDGVKLAIKGLLL